MNRMNRLAPLAAAALLASLALVGCSSDEDTTAGAAADPVVSAPAQTAPAVPGGQAPDPALFDKARQCLEAAGVDIPELPSGAPSFEPGQTPPDGAQLPEGFDGLAALFSNPQVTAALQACGIELPTAPPIPTS